MSALDYIKAELLNLRAEYDSAEDSALLAELENQKAIIRAAQARIAEIERLRQGVFQKRTAIRNNIREKERELSDAERAAELAAENARLAAERAAKDAETDARTANAPWRSFALPHQLEGSAFMATAKRAVCADDMGLGKTLQSLMWLDRVDAKRVLVVTPGDVMSNFIKEANRWTPERAAIVIGHLSKFERDLILDLVQGEDNFMLVINYEAWARDKSLIRQLIDMRFDSVIVDEAHNIKETKTSAYQGVADIVFGYNQCPVNACTAAVGSNAHVCTVGHDTYSLGIVETIEQSVKNLICMTGTPILNRPGEIYPLLHLVNMDIFPTQASFNRDYCTFDPYTGKHIFKTGGESMLAESIKGFYIRRTKHQAGIVLPPQTIVEHDIELDPEQYPLQAKFLQMLKEHATIEISEGRAATTVSQLALITRLRQGATWPGGVKIKQQRYDEFGNEEMEWSDTKMEFVDVYDEFNVGENFKESAKMDAAEALIRELNDEGQRVVVFSQFKQALIELSSRLGDRSVRYDGDTDQRIRSDIKSNFDRSAAEPVRWDNVLCHYRTGGVGLNLTAATAVVVLDEEWNPGKSQQAWDRVNRMGQTEDTSVHIFRLSKSIDEWMAKLIDQKRQVVTGFDNSMSAAEVNDFLTKNLMEA